jgi:hypothetical protein
MGKKKSGTKKPVKEVKKKNDQKAKAEKPKAEAKPVQKSGKGELEKLRQTVLEAKTRLDNAKAEARNVEQNVLELVAREKNAYLKALIPYRDACKKAGIECEFSGGRLANVSERVTFLVEKVDKGIKVAIKGKPETEEVIPFAKLKESVNRAAFSFTDKHLGLREQIGNKGGGLSNRLRALWK